VREEEPRLRAKTRIPRQQRSIDTRRRILEAAEALFSEEGFHATNTKRIAARAGVAVGSLYAYFRDKKQILLAVLEEHNRSIAKRITLVEPDPGVSADKEGILGGLIREILDAHHVDPGLHREITMLSRTDPDVRHILEKHEEQQRAMAAHYLAAWQEHVSIDDPEAAAFVIFSAIESVVHALVLQETDLDWDRLTRQLTTMISRYLFAGPVNRPIDRGDADN
jgi:AcrR family transcriptional regulator